jgi:hypothetical protein
MKTRKIFILVFLTFALNFSTFTSSAQWQRFNFTNLKLYGTNSKRMYSVPNNLPYYLFTIDDWQTWDTINLGYSIKFFACDEYGNILNVTYQNNKYHANIANNSEGPFQSIYQRNGSFKGYIHGNIVYLYGMLDTIYSSINHGNNFFASFPFYPSSGYPFETTICDSLILTYLFYSYQTGSEEIWKTSYDMGTNWSYRNDNLFGRTIIKAPPYIFLAKQMIYRSSDGGHTFSSCSPVLGNGIVSFAYGNGVLLAGTNNGGVYATTNKGNTWVAFNDGLDTLCCNAYVAVTDSFYYVTLNDSITYRRSIHDLTGIATHATEPTISLLPNPATDFLTLKIENVQLLPFTFQLYNLQGSLQKEGKTSNSQTEINVATLPRGLYILKIITEKEIITKKVVLQ